MTKQMRKGFQFALLLSVGFWLSACFGVDGGGGGIDPVQATFLNGTYSSGTKSFVFQLDGSYEYFVSEEQLSSKKAEISSKYEVRGTDINMERADGTKFAEPAKLSEDKNSFTWAEHPGETFAKKQ